MDKEKTIEVLAKVFRALVYTYGEKDGTVLLKELADLIKEV